ncbi:MAG: AMP-binding protein, partial [Rhizobiales bacterium]|nr:AMP-binding protein [Hyphomicrobiales bacterium]
MNKKPALSVSLNTLLKQGLTVNDGPLWMQGDNVTTRREARLMVASAQSAFKASGMARGDRLALYGTPSPQSLAALLAALIDEIVIVPIDESLNLARKNQMLELAMPKAILNLSDADDFAPDLIQVTLEKSGDTLATNLSPLIDQSDPNAPCYIFFTSGSTGVPKPVLGRSSGLAHFIAWEKDCLNLSINDRVSLLTRFSFDVVLRDILLPLVSGCISVLPSNNKPMAAHSTMEWISEHGITVFHTVPSVANALLSATTNQSSTISLKHTLFAGEPLSGSLVERWRVRFPNSVVHNLYGPTETTLAKFHAEVPVPATAGIQCCGTALPETDVVILSEARVPTTFGEMGEVAISTPFASLGYATQTDDIIPIVSRIDGADWYLTGDVGFFDQDGDLHLRGRKDDQVKIMGVRLELAGVSALMEIHPLIEKAVVIAEEDEQGQKSLIAWYIAEPECTLTASDIRSFLADRSPPAGIPGHLISCDDFPVTPNGKIDKARLPRPNSSQD